MYISKIEENEDNGRAEAAGDFRVTCKWMEPTKQKMGREAIKGAGYRKLVFAHVEVEVEAAVATVAAGSAAVGSSLRAGSVGSALFRGGEFAPGRLATDKVGELVDCD